MSATQRTKGKRGETEAAAIIRDLTGWTVTRRVRQHGGDSDLIGIPGWSAEVKRHRAAGRAVIAAWWGQTVAQATRPSPEPAVSLPVLFYRLDRDEWRAVWPLALSLGVQSEAMWREYAWTAESSIEGWAAVARDLQLRRGDE